LAKQQKKNIQEKVVLNNQKSIFDNDYIFIGILILFWFIFFRELISGSAFLFDDFIEQYYPSKFMASVMIKNGIFPFWNPYIFSGMPFFADLQIAVLYPFNLMLTLFVSANKLSPLVIQNSILIHYLIGSVFAYYLAKYFKVSNFLSFVFAVLYTYSSYMIIHMIHMPLIEAAIWFPLFFLLWLKFIDTNKFIYPLFAGIVMALCILAGYPQVPFLSFFFIGIYTLFIIWKEYKAKNKIKIVNIIIGLLIVGFFTAGLTAFQLLPTLEFIGLSNRAEFDYNFAKQGSLHPFDFISFFIPKFFGVWSGNEKITDLQYWSKHQEGPWMFTVANVFISTFVIVSFIPSLLYLLKNNKYKIITYFSLFIIGFSLLFALGGNFFFHKLLYDFVPFFNRFRNPAHILFLTTTVFLLINILGLNGIIAENKMKQYFSKKYFIGLSVFIILIYLIATSGMFLSKDVKQVEQISSWIKGQYLIFFVFSATFGLIFYFFSQGKIKNNLFTGLVTVMLLFEIHLLWFDVNNGTKNPEQMYFQKSPQMTAKFKEDMKNEHFRVNMRDGGYMLLQRNQGFIDNVEYLEGYGALMLKNFIPPNNSAKGSTQTHDLMNVKYKVFTDSTGKNKSLGVSNTYLPRAMMFYDVKKFNNDEEVKKFMMSSDFDYRKTLAIEDKENIKLISLKDSILPSNNVNILEYSLNNIKIEVNTSEDGYLYLSEVYYPAWKAFINKVQTKIFKTDYCMRSVFVEKGNHIIEFKYESDTFKTGLLFSFISLGLLIILFPIAIFLPKRLKNTKKNEHTD